VRVHRAYKEHARRVGETKTDEGVREVMIPPWLLPLLTRIAGERKPNDRVSPWLLAPSTPPVAPMRAPGSAARCRLRGVM
jgi:hypothetical protein